MSAERRTEDGAEWQDRRRIGLAVLAFAVGFLLICRAAVAGDYYLRGGIGLDWRGNTEFADVDCSSTAPAALNGCGTGGDGAPYRFVADFGTMPAVELGLGYAQGPGRFELLIEYRPRFAFKGRANFLAPGTREEVRAKLSSVSGMLAGFVDLDGPGALEPGPFAPLVGAGVGVVHTRIGKTTMAFPATTTTVPSGNRTGLAWMVTAGVAMVVGARTMLDLACRYTDLGKVRTDRGPGRVVWRDGSREPGAAAARPRVDRGEAEGARRASVTALRLLKFELVSEWRRLPQRDTRGAGLQVVAPVGGTCYSIRNLTDCAKTEAHG